MSAQRGPLPSAEVGGKVHVANFLNMVISRDLNNLGEEEIKIPLQNYDQMVRMMLSKKEVIQQVGNLVNCSGRYL